MLVLCWTSEAQPVGRSKREIGSLWIYNDFKQNNLFYYAPGNLKLAYEKDGKPRFQLLEMRYTGTSSHGDSGEKRFMNVVQFTVAMEEIDTDELKAVKEQLGASPIDLRPLPIRDIEAILVTPVGDPDSKSPYKKIGKDGSFQSESAAGNSDKNGFWTERSFTLKLENHEAQLLWDQVTNGQLALSLGYAFYADIIPFTKGDVKVTGGVSAEEFESDQEDILAPDTIPVTQIIKADAFPVRVDVEKWPDLIKKIDINEGIPPAYAALEVRCFDFTDDLRPDLAIKAIDITATGVGGQTVSIPTQKFLRSEPDLFSKQIHFPYAVKMTEPFRYRIVEYTKEGSRNVTEWKTINSLDGHLDITTPAKDNLFVKKELEIEVPLNEFSNEGVSKVSILLKYKFSGRPYSTIITYKTDDPLPIRQASIKCDKNETVSYEAIWAFADDTTISTPMGHVAEDNYLYLSIPDK